MDQETTNASPPPKKRGIQITRSFALSAVTLAVSILILVVLQPNKAPGLQGLAIAAITISGLIFSLSFTRLLLRGLLWRVGSRLFISYTLIGVVPISTFAITVYLGWMMVAGQLAGIRVAEIYVDRVQLLEEVAGQLADDPTSFADVLITHAKTLPDLGFAQIDGSGNVIGEGLLDPASLLPVSWFDSSATTVLTHLGSQGWGALASLIRQGDTVTVVYLPTGPGLIRSIGVETGVVTVIDIGRKDRHGETPNASGAQDPAVSVGPEVNFPSMSPLQAGIISWMHIVEQRPVQWLSGEPRSNEYLGFGVRTSLASEFEHLYGLNSVDFSSKFDSTKPLAFKGRIVLGGFLGLSALTVAVYLIASLLAMILVARIARATGRLSTGFAAIKSGAFTHRIRLPGRDQLAELVGGFNSMAEHLESSVAEVARKESLERELAVARDLQRRLLPSSEFRFEGVEIATDFAPASAIGGDFYHFVDEGDGRLVVVIADVSGHGLATGIVMASAKASLSALTGSGVDTARIFATLDQEILATTSRRTFVTLSHLRFDLPGRQVEVTNAGHLYPYRRPKGGLPVEIANPSRPLGVHLPQAFRTVSSELAVGDLWVLLSDGILEAINQDDDIFGFDRFTQVLSDAPEDASAAELRDFILAAWTEFTGTEEPDDDRTLLVIKVL